MQSNECGQRTDADMGQASNYGNGNGRNFSKVGQDSSLAGGKDPEGVFEARREKRREGKRREDQSFNQSIEREREGGD